MKTHETNLNVEIKALYQVGISLWTQGRNCFLQYFDLSWFLGKTSYIPLNYLGSINFAPKLFFIIYLQIILIS
jgi:hypothetical protein